MPLKREVIGLCDRVESRGPAAAVDQHRRDRRRRPARRLQHRRRRAWWRRSRLPASIASTTVDGRRRRCDRSVDAWPRLPQLGAHQVTVVVRSARSGARICWTSLAAAEPRGRRRCRWTGWRSCRRPTLSSRRSRLRHRGRSPTPVAHRPRRFSTWSTTRDDTPLLRRRRGPGDDGSSPDSSCCCIRPAARSS